MIIEMMMTIRLMIIMFMRDIKAITMLAYQCFYQKKGSGKNDYKGPYKTFLKMLQQSCTYSKVRADCEQLSIRESKILFS